jgi:hypothetical protein
MFIKRSCHQVGDVVRVAPRPGPGGNGEGGVARVTGVGPNGCYDVKFVVGSARGVAVAPAWMSAVGVGPQSDSGGGLGGGQDAAGVGCQSLYRKGHSF